MVTTAKTIAAFFLKALRERDEKPDRMKIQKLLYYAQGEHLGRYGTPLFAEEIQAWTYGPVQPDVYHAMKSDEKFQAPSPPQEIIPFLEEIVREYANIPTADIMQQTHLERPWIIARGTLAPEESSNAVISHESMRSFFRKSRSEREEYARQMGISGRILERDHAVWKALAEA